MVSNDITIILCAKVQEIALISKYRGGPVYPPGYNYICVYYFTEQKKMYFFSANWSKSAANDNFDFEA